MKSETKSTPALRFPEFSGGWSEDDLGNLAEVTTGNKDTQDSVVNGNYPFFVRSQTVERIDTFSYAGEAILTSGDGVGVGKNFHYINGKFDFHQRVYCVRNFADGLSGKFLFFCFSEKFNRRVMRMSAKNSVDSVRRDMIVKMPIMFPSLSEQQKIAAFLSAVDEKIGQFTRKRDLLLKYKKGAMQQILSQKVRFKDDYGNDFPDWESTRLSDVCQINPRSGELPETFVYIDLESVESGSLNKEKLLGRDEAPSRAQRVLEKGDILFQMVRPYQSNNLIFDRDGSFVASTGYAQIRSRIDTAFLFQLLLTYPFVKNVVRRCTGTSYPAINSEDLAEIKIDIPIRQEQEKIGEILTQIDNKIGLVGQQIERTQAFKTGLLQRMLV